MRHIYLASHCLWKPTSLSAKHIKVTWAYTSAVVWESGDINVNRAGNRACVPETGLVIVPFKVKQGKRYPANDFLFI